MKRFLQSIAWALLLVALVCLWVAAIPADAEDGPLVKRFIFALLAVIVGCVAHPVIHETGHLLVALAVRVPVIAFRVFGLTLGCTSANAPSCVVMMKPRSDMPHLRARFVAIAGGGPAANIVVALAFAFASCLGSWTPLVRSELAGFAIPGLVIGLSNLLPIRAGGHDSDGRVILGWLRRPEVYRDRILDREAGVVVNDIPMEIAQLDVLAEHAKARNPEIAGVAAHRMVILLDHANAMTNEDMARHLWAHA